MYDKGGEKLVYEEASDARVGGELVPVSEIPQPTLLHTTFKDRIRGLADEQNKLDTFTALLKDVRSKLFEVGITGEEVQFSFSSLYTYVWSLFEASGEGDNVIKGDNVIQDLEDFLKSNKILRPDEDFWI